ncbi:sensor histidine kinase [Streptomyces viridosporus]|uniref:sensor histidine kinase n=1 Tax=Streptomyces viridosporus TaxID=67581 RepID=UPI0009BE5E2F|nr:histidine kinase [Streptomyces viridosporus]
MTSAEEGSPHALLAGASRRWVRLLPWGVAFVLCVALLPTTIQVLSVDYGLNGGIASALAVAQTAPLLLAVIRPLQAWCMIFAADMAGALDLLTVDFDERLLWPFPPMEIVGYVGLCLALGLREPRRTLLEERARIARELHDVVAHHMSVITVQADTAAHRLDGLPPVVQEEFTSIAATARESLGEMRRLLGVLRNEEAHGELAPQPGLTRIGQLVEAVAKAGVPVEFAPCDADVPEVVGLSAYRIVQEALANVVRHAPGAPTQVSVSEDGERLTVLVVNGPPPEPPAAPLEEGGTGHGLIGMRERVRLADGTLDTGPLPDGGFRVAAQIPLAEGDFT